MAAPAVAHEERVSGEEGPLADEDRDRGRVVPRRMEDPDRDAVELHRLAAGERDIERDARLLELGPEEVVGADGGSGSAARR